MIKEARYKELFIYGAGLLYITVNAFAFYRGFHWMPLVALIPALFYLTFFSLDRLFMAVVFLTPLSVELSRLTGKYSFDLFLPTEPLILVILLIFLLRMIHYGAFDTRIIKHPVSLAVIFYLIWLIITTFTSTMPVVSLKFLLVRIWFIMVFYFFAIQLFKRRANIDKFFWCYILALFIVIVYTINNHAGYGLITQREAHWVVRPFYNDHTAYGAALAMFIPVLVFIGLRKRSCMLRLPLSRVFPGPEGSLPGGPYDLRWVAWLMLFVFMFALVFSYSRAAWLSLLAAFAVWVILRLRIRFSTLLSFALLSALLIFMLRHEIVREMEKNTQDSSADFREHIRSVTNITSDASNLERINRWKSAFGMFAEKPVFGWGPGTYMFRYAPFQFSYDRTIISTNSGDWGDAHSEYLGPLAETGLPGMLSFMAVATVILLTGFRLFRQLEKRRDRLIVAGVLLGLVTYLVHGLLNNFLHSDKAAVPFWGFSAILVAMDLYRKKASSIDAD